VAERIHEIYAFLTGAADPAVPAPEPASRTTS